MVTLLDVFIDSIWCLIVLWRMHFGHTWPLLWATIIICYVVFSQNSISTLPCVLTSTMYRSLRLVSIVNRFLDVWFSTGLTIVRIGFNANLELVDKFCYLGDVLSVDGDADAAVDTKISIRWNKFRQLVPLLTNKDISLIMTWRLYSSCVRSRKLHGSETWPVRKENEVALQRAKMRMVRWMCGVKLQDSISSKGLRERDYD